MGGGVGLRASGAIRITAHSPESGAGKMGAFWESVTSVTVVLQTWTSSQKEEGLRHRGVTVPEAKAHGNDSTCPSGACAVRVASKCALGSLPQPRSEADPRRHLAAGQPRAQLSVQRWKRRRH